jgi:hypothetical protein
MRTKKYISLGQGLITDLDLSSYTGETGQTIRIVTPGNHRDQEVKVVIRDVLGSELEGGFATWDEVAGSWSYFTTATMPPGEIILITADADSPAEKSTRDVTCVPFDLHLATEFKTAPWAVASGLGRWKEN